MDIVATHDVKIQYKVLLEAVLSDIFCHKEDPNLTFRWPGRSLAPQVVALSLASP